MCRPDEGGLWSDAYVYPRWVVNDLWAFRAPFRHLVAHIVLMRAKEQVFWAHTPAVIASVTDNQPIGDFSIGENVSDAVGTRGLDT
jgi:hypothetical protein